MTTREYTALNLASDVFRNLGIAAADRRLYAVDHPRYQESLKQAAESARRYFEDQPNSAHLTYLLKRGHVEFRRIPLVDLGAQGERLVKVLEEGDVAGVQVRRNITPEDTHDLLDVLRQQARADRSAGGDSPELGAADSRLAKFRLISEQVARRLDRAAPDADLAIADADAAEEDDITRLPDLLVSEASLRSILNTYRTLVANVENGTAMDFDVIKNASDQALSLLASNDEFSLPRSSGYFDDFTFHHSVNVSLIAARVASSVVQDEDLLSSLALAGLLHDIGKSQIPTEILHKPGRLSDAEYECVKTHPVVGAEILLGMNEVDPLCVGIAFGHHMYDGHGRYPTTPFAFELDWITQLVSVVDVYEALTAVRPYKKGFSSKKAFEIMLSMPGLQDRLPVVKLLYECLGLYPVGSYVELNTGERALVVGKSARAPHLPKVKILSDDKGNRLSEGIDLDLSQTSVDSDGAHVTRTVVRQSQDDDPLQMDIIPETDEILGEAAAAGTWMSHREA
ncbi:MAG: HD domain-containing protein [Planctomycetota bacterium]|nr:HD domain-containing protein [Planctomycetota bacterium]